MLEWRKERTKNIFYRKKKKGSNGPKQTFNAFFNSKVDVVPGSLTFHSCQGLSWQSPSTSIIPAPHHLVLIPTCSWSHGFQILGAGEGSRARVKAAPRCWQPACRQRVHHGKQPSGARWCGSRILRAHSSSPQAQWVCQKWLIIF